MKHDTITYTFRYRALEGSYLSSNREVELCAVRLGKYFVYPQDIKRLYITLSKVKPDGRDYLTIYPDKEDGTWDDLRLSPQQIYSTEALYWTTSHWLRKHLEGVKRAYVWVEYDQ